jgi:signal transduction histidine kinase
VSLRFRLFLALLAAAVPVVALLVWQHARLERAQLVESLAEFAYLHVDDFARRRCEADPEHFPPEPLAPRGPLARFERRREHEFWTYGPDFRSANPRAPAFPPELAAALAGEEREALHLVEREGETLAYAGVRMPWDEGPCAVVLVQRKGPLPPSVTRALLQNALILLATMLLAVLLAAGPVVERVRALAAEVRRSAANRYAEPIAVRGTDEVAELAAAFNAAGIELRAHLTTTEERARALRDFVANTTHDVMLPLTVLQGHLVALRKRLEDRPGELAVTRDALEEVHYLTSLVQNLGAAARLEGDAVELVRRPLVLDELVERVLARQRPIARERRITLEHALPGEPLTITADSVLLEQAVSNVVHNAVRHGRDGGHVLVSVEERGAERFALRVVDDGPGIAPADLARLGERRFRTDAARARAPEGLGLGLSIAREIALRHGYELTLQPAESGGLAVEFAGLRGR